MNAGNPYNTYIDQFEPRQYSIEDLQNMRQEGSNLLRGAQTPDLKRSFDIMKQQGYQGNFKDFMERLQKDPSFLDYMYGGKKKK